MNFSVEENILTVSFSAIATVALGLLMLLLGQAIKDRSKFLKKYCIPASVIGGVLFALVNLILHQAGVLQVVMDTAYQTDMQNLFFTAVGFTITFSMVKKGGSRLVRYLIMASILAVLQGVVGVITAKLIGVETWLGLICGPASLSGGHGNAAAYGGILDEMGRTGASVVGMAAATFGLVTGGFFGGPLAKQLIKKHHLARKANDSEDDLADAFTDDKVIAKAPTTTYTVFTHIALLTAFLAIGAWFQSIIKAQVNISLPGYASSALMACIFANINEKYRFFHTDERVIRGIEEFSLGVFLSIAMVSLNLWQLISLAIPMIIILIVGLIVTLLYIAFIVFPVCGKDYDAAIMCAGMTGHGLGASPAGFANMSSVTQIFGDSKISFLCVTVVGGVLIDWVLLVVNTTMVNLFG